MTVDELNGKNVAVCGVGVSNLPLIDFLLDKGAKVFARDKKTYEKMGNTATLLESKGVTLILGDDYLENITEDIIFRSPGIRYDKPQFVAAVNNGAVLTSEMQLFFELCPATIIGVTGSDGKTTTTTLISKMLEAQFGSERVYVGGNIGRPLLPVVEKMSKEDFAVVELSSFQLHTMTLSPHISVVTNISPNHLDYHTDMNEYIDAKKNIFIHNNNRRLVLNSHNDITDGFDRFAKKDAEIIKFMSEKGIYERDGAIYFGEEKILDISDIFIPGHHNVENFMAAIGALHGIVSNDVIVNVAKTFGGVEHRIEFVRELRGVKYYNSSIDSSPTRTIAALNSFKQKLIVISGGYDKHIPFEPLCEPMCRMVKKLILTGATAGKIKSALINSDEYKAMPFPIIEEPDFEKAVLKASSVAENGDIVILSPACASFDAFPNFEVRGRRFKEIVKSI